MTKSNVAAVDNTAAFITYLNIVYRKEDGLCFQHLNQGQYVDDFVLPVDETDAVWLLLKLRNVIIKDPHNDSSAIFKHDKRVFKICYESCYSGITIKVKYVEDCRTTPYAKMNYSTYVAGKSILDGLTDCTLELLKEV